MPRLLEAAMPPRTGLVLRRMSGHEELGRLPEFQLEFVSKKGEIPAGDILGKDITWSLELDNGEKRYFNGFVTSFAEAGQGLVPGFTENDRDAYFYQATVNPGLWFLTRASDCRIFENMTAIDAAKAILSRYPYMSVEARLSRNYPKRLYNVQYRETDFNFVSRLLEQEGVYLLCEYGNGETKLVLADSPAAHQRSRLRMPFNAELRGGVSEQDHVATWGVKREIQPGKYILDDFHYPTPGALMTAEEPKKQAHDLAEFTMYDFPGEYTKLEEGKHYAKTRVDELHARYEQFSGSGCVRMCSPGTLLALTGHPRTQYNGKEYLVTAVAYTATAGDLASGGAGADFHCSFTAIDAKTEFRPARITPKPIIQGPQTAIVTGPAGQEIATDDDKMGRIKVRFHWGREECSSCWVRVSQPIAGNKWGFFALPRIGQEVVVSFLEGDPDHPLVTGSVYNGKSLPPYDLPTQKTRTGFKSRSTPDGSADTLNELRFEDKKGEEEIYIQAQKDKSIRIKNNRLEYVGNDSHLVVMKDAYEKRDGEHHVMLKSNRNEKLGGSLSLNVGQDLQGKIGKNLAYDAGMEIHLKAGMKLVLEAGMQIDLKAAGGFVSIGPAGVTISGTMVMINSGGAAGSGSGASPKAPKEAIAAAETKGGDKAELPKKKDPVTVYKPQAKKFKLAAASGAPAVSAS